MHSLKNRLRSREGFTLVELIIVIMIIGILSATLLPRVMGAPARARDAGRIKDLDSLALALQQYYTDHNEFPGVNGTGECLGPADGGSGQALVTGGFLLESNFPIDPSKNATVSGCSDGYYYVPITKNGIDKNSFMVAADVENDGSANSNSNCVAQTTVKAADTCIDGSVMSTNEGDDGNLTGAAAIFVKIGGV